MQGIAAMTYLVPYTSTQRCEATEFYQTRTHTKERAPEIARCTLRNLIRSDEEELQSGHVSSFFLFEKLTPDDLWMDRFPANGVLERPQGDLGPLNVFPRRLLAFLVLPA